MSEQDLFGPTGPKPAKGKKKAQPESDGLVGRAMARYYGWYERLYGCKPIGAGGRLAKFFRETGDAWGEHGLNQVIDAFFTTKDYKINSTVRSVAVFIANAERLKIGTAAVGQQTAADRRIVSNMEAAARASEEPGENKGHERAVSGSRATHR